MMLMVLGPAWRTGRVGGAGNPRASNVLLEQGYSSPILAFLNGWKSNRVMFVLGTTKVK